MQRAVAHEQHIPRIVLVLPPRVSRSLLGQFVHAAEHVAGLQVDDWLTPEAVRCYRSADLVATPIHVIEQPADVLADKISLQRPRRVGVSKGQSEVGHA